MEELVFSVDAHCGFIVINASVVLAFITFEAMISFGCPNDGTLVSYELICVAANFASTVFEQMLVAVFDVATDGALVVVCDCRDSGCECVRLRIFDVFTDGTCIVMHVFRLGGLKGVRLRALAIATNGTHFPV